MSCLCVAVLTGGCLSLGGRTTYVQETPETQRRIDSLEGRVSALEQMLHPPREVVGMHPESNTTRQP